MQRLPLERRDCGLPAWCRTWQGQEFGGNARTDLLVEGLVRSGPKARWGV
jgi:hypothetical protein